MSLNFGRSLTGGRDSSVEGLGSVSLRKITSNQPVVQSSRMVATEHSPKSRDTGSRMQNTEHSITSKPDEPLKDMVDDSNSQNKSATSQGTGLANKIGLAISRILANTSNSKS